MNKNFQIVLVGGNGFIGKALGKALLLKGYKNITTVSRGERAYQNPDIPNISGIDITNPKTLEVPMASADIVINLAGCISFAQNDREKLLQINGEGALNVLRACEKNKKLHRFIHVSSTSAFGVPSREIDETFRFDWSKNNRFVYSYSKFMANDAIDNSMVPTNIIYPSASFGSGNKNTQKILKYAKNKKYLFLPPGANSIMDVRDLVESIIVILEKAPLKENYILCGETFRFSDLFRMICNALGQNTKIIIFPQWFKKPMLILARLVESFGSQKIGYEQMYLSFHSLQYSNKKLKKLGYTPKYSLFQTLKDILLEEPTQ